MISAADYNLIADYISEYIADIESSITQLNGVRTTLDDMVGDDDYKTNLEYAVQLSAYFLGTLKDNPKDIIVAVRSLQTHVSNNFGNVNLFLSTNSIKVKQTFADISGLAGYDIDDTNIE